LSISEQISPLVGRFVLAWFFLSEAWFRANLWHANVALLDKAQIPVPALVLLAALIVMTLGGLALALGFHTRHGAMLLFAFMIVVTVMMYDYWNFADASRRAAEYELFARNIAIAGGLLVLVGVGPGRFAFDNEGKK